MFVENALPLNRQNPGNRWQTLQIGITENCNLICRHCGRTAHRWGEGTVDLNTFTWYLSRFSPKWFHELLLSDFGEPTIVENFLQYLYVAKRSGWHNVQFFTNGTTTNRHLLESIVAHRLVSRMIVSVEAASPELYEDIRRGASHSSFLSFLKMVSDLKAFYKSPLELFFNVCCMKVNLSELPDIIRMARDFGIMAVFMVHINPIEIQLEGHGKLLSDDQHLDTVDRDTVVSAFQEVVNLARANDIIVTLPEEFPEISVSQVMRGPPIWDPPAKPSRCNEPFRWVQVRKSGNIYPCCQMGGRYSMGNLNDLDFLSIWNNLLYRQLTEGLIPDRMPLEVCRECNVIKGKNF